MTNVAQCSEESDFDRLVIWRDSKISGELFMGLPDHWYESPTWACEKGHISHHYIKSEARGAICSCCMKPVVLVPPGTTERTLADALAR